MVHIHSDHLNTPQAVTDQNQQVVWKADYKPFGEAEPTVTTLDMPLRFPGQIFDSETNLHYNYFRTYDPGIGRYVQSDPIGLKAGPNLYTYVSNRPLSSVDPSGLVEWKGSMSVVSAQLGGGATRMSFDLKTQCVNGERGSVSVVAGGFSVGLGGGVGGYSKITFEDGKSSVDPFVFSGRAMFASASYAFIGLGYSYSAIELGSARSVGGGYYVGYDASIIGGAGISTVVSSSVETCCE